MIATLGTNFKGRKWKAAGLMAAVFLASTLYGAVAMAQEGTWMVRARGLYVQPDEKATITPINGTVGVTAPITPELDFTYFMTDNVAMELILATTRHTVTAVGTDLGDVALGRVSLLPPTLSLQYHITDFDGFKPYFGAGANLTMFYNADAPGTTVTDIDYDTSFGFALQAGVDVETSTNWYLNFDMKKLFLKTDVAINGGAISADVTLNPWIFGIGVGRKF